MFVWHPQRIIFIHPPKNGGTAIVSALGASLPESSLLAHATPFQAREVIFQADWDQFYSFTIVRNPWRRYVSLYHYHRSDSYLSLRGKNLSYRRARDHSLLEWFDLNIAAEIKSNWFGVPQSTWTDGVREVFRLENIDQMEISLSKKFGRNIKISQINSHSPNKSSHLSQRAIEYIYDIDRKTIEDFFYEYTV